MRRLLCISSTDFIVNLNIFFGDDTFRIIRNGFSHVTIYLYTHPEKFSIRLLPLPNDLEGRYDLRFTLDTIEDFTLLQTLYATYREKTDGSIEALLKLVESNPEYRVKMLENIAHNEK